MLTATSGRYGNTVTRNVGSAPFTFFKFDQTDRDDQFNFSVTSGPAAILSKYSPNNNLEGHRMTLLPNEHYVCEMNIRDWCELSQIGDYELQGTFRIQFYKDQSANDILWEDVVARDFHVVVNTP